MDINFKATYENGYEHKFTVHINLEKGQNITDAFLLASRVAGSITDCPIINITREV